MPAKKMPVEEALEELKKYAREFTNIGDAREAVKEDKPEFLHKWIKVLQYYNYVKDNSMGDPMASVEAKSIVENIGVNNPSLVEWSKMILEPKEFDTAIITGPLEDIILDIKSSQRWDKEKIEDLSYELNKYGKMLIEHRSSFTKEAYDSLLNDVQSASKKLNALEKMFDTDLIKSTRGY